MLKSVSLSVAFLLGFCASFGQCSSGCSRTNPSSLLGLSPLNVAAGEVVCITSDRGYSAITVADGGTLNICDANVGGNLGVIVGATGEVNVYGSSIFYSLLSGINSSGTINLNSENARAWALQGINSNGNFNTWTCADDGTISIGLGGTSVDPSTLGNCMPLPIELLSFSGKQITRDSIELNWTADVGSN